MANERGYRESGSQCNLQVLTDGESSDASITAESVSSSSYKLHRRDRTSPNHFRTQTAPSRLQRQRKSSKRSAGQREHIPDDASETSSLDAAHHSHITCQVSNDAPGFYEYHRPYSVYCKPLRRPLSLPEAFDDSEKLNHPHLDPGQKEYLWHTASVYSVGNLKSLSQRRFRQALDHQVATGFATKEECERYYKYLMGSRKRQYQTDHSVWKAPPKLPVRPKHFHRRTRSYDQVQETRRANIGLSAGQRSQGHSQGSSPKEDLNDSMSKLSIFYSTDMKRTLARKRQDNTG